MILGVILMFCWLFVHLSLSPERGRSPPVSLSLSVIELKQIGSEKLKYTSATTAENNSRIGRQKLLVLCYFFLSFCLFCVVLCALFCFVSFFGTQKKVKNKTRQEHISQSLPRSVHYLWRWAVVYIHDTRETTKAETRRPIRISPVCTLWICKILLSEQPSALPTTKHVIKKSFSWLLQPSSYTKVARASIDSIRIWLSLRSFSRSLLLFWCVRVWCWVRLFSSYLHQLFERD